MFRTNCKDFRRREIAATTYKKSSNFHSSKNRKWDRFEAPSYF